MTGSVLTEIKTVLWLSLHIKGKLEVQMNAEFFETLLRMPCYLTGGSSDALRGEAVFCLQD